MKQILKKPNNHFWLTAIVPLLFSCSSGADYVPKPKGYPRIDFPAKKYIVFDTAVAPYTFEMPVYASMEKDTLSNYTPDPTWFNMVFKPYNATLHITYYKFGNWVLFDSLVYDTRKLVQKHMQKADDIIEEPFRDSENKTSGLIFRIQGNTATNLNFYATDSSRHFFRGALYFNKKTNPDSIAPVYQFIREDVMHLIKTLKWK